MKSYSLARRALLKLLGATGLAAGASSVPGCSASADDSESSAGAIEIGTYEYIVVGSGAGGGPLAANLARSGHKVLLLEAGEDKGTRLNYQVPAFHAKSTEDDTMRWDYFVKHYSDDSRQAADSKLSYDEAPDGRRTPKGVLYPRAGTLGGCTAHNAMITVLPHERDWDGIASITGDASWSGSNMRRYFETLERCQYMTRPADLQGHGERGWLSTERPDPMMALTDAKILVILQSAAATFARAATKTFLGSLIADVRELLGTLKRDINTVDPARDQSEGLFSIPLATAGGKRNGPREFLLRTVKEGYPLTIKTGALASRVLFEHKNGKQRATGVAFLEGTHLYRADPKAIQDGTPNVEKTARASREVILSAGAFNTPQLLKLSGVGSKAELSKLGIAVKVELPGVGRNLQDRYEVGVVSEVASDFNLLARCTFGQNAADPCLNEWLDGKGPYTSNGAVLGIVKKSTPDKEVPDLFIFGLASDFKGYEPGYAERTTADKRHFTWAILKAHTGNTAGTVTLRSKDPRDVPEINFRYFDEGSTDSGQHEKDLAAVVSGVEFARAIGDKTNELLLTGDFTEVFPGRAVKTKEEIGAFVKNEAWGHHASCTCPIGSDSDPMAVLDSKLRVRGTEGLRVVDASIFPKIPGFFIVTAIYMVAEKATDILLGDIGEKRK